MNRFNELNIDVYRDYRTSIAYDLNHKLEKQAFSGHSDIVARRMGFIALPLGILFARVFFASVDICNVPATIIFIIGLVNKLAPMNSIILIHFYHLGIFGCGPGKF